MRASKSLEVLFARAGRAEAKRRDAEKREKAERQREARQHERRRLHAVAMAPEAAKRVHAWLDGVEAHELRTLLRTAGLAEVRLVGWLNDEGEPLRGATHGAWCVSLLPKPVALRVTRIGAPMGGRCRVVDHPDALLAVAAPEIIVALDRALTTGHYQGTLRAALKAGGRPGVVRLLF